MQPAIGRWIACITMLGVVSCTKAFDMSSELINRPGPEWGVVIGSVLVQAEGSGSDNDVSGRDALKDSYEFDIVQIQPADPEGENAYAQWYHLRAKAGEEHVFVSRLPPGQYLLKRFRENRVTGIGGDLNLVFVAAPGETRYIGRVLVEIPRRVSRGKAYRFTVENARETTLPHVLNRHADLAGTVVDAPIQARLQVMP